MSARNIINGIYSYLFPEMGPKIPVHPLVIQIEKSAADEYIQKDPSGNPIYRYDIGKHFNMYALTDKFFDDLEKLSLRYKFQIEEHSDSDMENTIGAILHFKGLYIKPGDIQIWISQFHTPKIIREVLRREREGNNNASIENLFDDNIHTLTEEYNGLPFIHLDIIYGHHIKDQDKEAYMKMVRQILRRMSHTDTEQLEAVKKKIEALEGVRLNLPENISRRVLPHFLLDYKPPKNNDFFAKGLTRKRSRGSIKNLIEERLVKKRGGATLRKRRGHK